MAKYGAHPLANTQALATVRTENAPGQCPTWPISLLQDGQLACSVTCDFADDFAAKSAVCVRWGL